MKPSSRGENWRKTAREVSRFREKTSVDLFSRQGGHFRRLVLSPVTIQITPESRPTTPPWMGAVAAFAQILTQTGILTQIQEHVRFARARFGRYEVIDFVAVLIGYMLSGEPTLLAFYDRLAPWASPFMALFGVGVAVELFFTLGPLVALALLYTRWIHVGALLLCLTMLIGLLWGFGGHFLFPGGDNTMTHATNPAAPAFLITSILVFIVPWAGITASISTFTQALHQPHGRDTSETDQQHREEASPVHARSQV